MALKCSVVTKWCLLYPELRRNWELLSRVRDGEGMRRSSINQLLKSRSSASAGGWLRASHSPYPLSTSTATFLHSGQALHQEVLWDAQLLSERETRIKESLDSEFLLSVLMCQEIPGCDYNAKWTNQVLIAMSDDNLLRGAYSLIGVQHSAWKRAGH